MCSFEFNQTKNISNSKKHGIDFIEAQKLWNDPEFVEIQAKSDKEIRSLVIGLIGEKHWSSVITYRGDNIRIISVRRSRKLEVELYES